MPRFRNGVQSAFDIDGESDPYKPIRGPLSDEVVYPRLFHLFQLVQKGSVDLARKVGWSDCSQFIRKIPHQERHVPSRFRCCYHEVIEVTPIMMSIHTFDCFEMKLL